MQDQIFLINDKDELLEMNQQGFVTEDRFQKLLEEHPNLLSGSLINPDAPRKWVLVSREIGIPDEESGASRWAIDHLFIDQDSIPTLVEVKRSTDTRLRREVVGQMLDYAANAVSFWNASEIRMIFENTCKQKNLDHVIEISNLVNSQYSYQQFWDQLETNLTAGKIRMLFVADLIPKELQSIIEFLNEQMTPAEVLGVEIKQYKNNEFKTLVPRVMGRTIEAQKKKGTRKAKEWTEKLFLAEIKELGNDTFRVTQELLTFAKSNNVRLEFGSGAIHGSVFFMYNYNEVSHYLFVLWTDGKLEIPFGNSRKSDFYKPVEKRNYILAELNDIIETKIPKSKVNKHPSFRIEELADQDKLDSFTSFFNGLILQIQEFNDNC